MSIDSDKLFNIYSINKIIRNDGTIDLTNLEVLSSLNDFIKSHSYTPNSSLKLNDEDLLELININKNIDDTRTFLEKIETYNYASNCSSNIELVIDTSKDVSPPPQEEEYVSPPQEKDHVSPPQEEEYVSPPQEEEEVPPPQEVEEEEVPPGIINSITSLNIKTSSKPTTRNARSQPTTRNASSQPITRKTSNLPTTRKSSSKATRKKGTK